MRRIRLVLGVLALAVLLLPDSAEAGRRRCRKGRCYTSCRGSSCRTTCGTSCTTAGTAPTVSGDYSPPSPSDAPPAPAPAADAK